MFAAASAANVICKPITVIDKLQENFDNKAAIRFKLKVNEDLMSIEM